jgi:hypothetical protein
MKLGTKMVDAEARVMSARYIVSPVARAAGHAGNAALYYIGGSVMVVRAAGDEILTQPSRSRESLGLCGPGNSPGSFLHGSFAQFEERSRVLCTQPVTYKSSDWFRLTQSFFFTRLSLFLDGIRAMPFICWENVRTRSGY